MAADPITHLAESAWALPLMALLVVGDALLVVLPGEIAVTALGALSVTTGSPPLVAVIAVAAVAAFTGDALVYGLGRAVGLERWRWMRRPRVRAALGWAQRRMRRNGGAIVFSARFVPFARLAVNLTAGATRAGPRYLAMAAAAALCWAAYQAVVGAVVASVVPGGPVVAVVVSVGIAVALGALLDALVTRHDRTRG